MNTSITKSKAKIHDQIATAIYHHELDFLGGSYSDIRVALLDDMIVVRLMKGSSTPAEKQLVAGDVQGLSLLKQLHHALFDQRREALAKTITSLVDSDVKGIFTDIDVSSGEKVIVFTFGPGVELQTPNGCSWLNFPFPGSCRSAAFQLSPPDDGVGAGQESRGRRHVLFHDSRLNLLNYPRVLTS